MFSLSPDLPLLTILIIIIIIIIIIIVADSEEKLRKLMSDFGRICERRNLRLNIGKSKVMKSYRYVNVRRMDKRLNGE